MTSNWKMWANAGCFSTGHHHLDVFRYLWVTHISLMCLKFVIIAFWGELLWLRVDWNFKNSSTIFNSSWSHPSSPGSLGSWHSLVEYSVSGIFSGVCFGLWLNSSLYLNKHDQINRFNVVFVLQSMCIYYIKIKNICQINIKNHSQAQDT